MKRTTRFLVLTAVLMLGIFLSACSGTIPAGAEFKLNPDGTSASAEFKGTVESIAPESWLISGVTVLVNSSSLIDGSIVVGDLVEVHATVALNSEVSAVKIELANPVVSSTPDAASSDDGSQAEGASTPEPGEDNHLTGKVESIAADLWVVSGQSIMVNASTLIETGILLGDVVKVEFILNKDATFIATQIEKAGDNQAHESYKGYIEFVGVVESLDPGNWVVSGQTLLIDAKTEIKGAILVGDTVKVEALPGAGSLTAIEIKLVGTTYRQKEENRNRFKLEGIVTQITDTLWVVNGQSILVNSSTDIESNIVVGDMVKVSGYLNTDGFFTAKEIENENSSSSSGSSKSDHDNRSDDSSNKSNSSNDDSVDGSDD
ncbi:MAG: hypothetical protein C0401_08295 [Anaerolinea sp.]|nr:hypothetical protein [Anaerolinea sp.]